MPRYYFDVINGHGLERDDIGVELNAPNDVRKQVAHILTDIAREELPGQDQTSIPVKVRDDVGFNVFSGELLFRSRWND